MNLPPARRGVRGLHVLIAIVLITGLLGGAVAQAVVTDPMYSWGINRYGQLGNGVVLPESVETPTSQGRSFTRVSAGSNQACGLTAAGAAYCWGINGAGLLGVGFSTPTPGILATPTVIPGHTFTDISVWQSICALKASGQAYCWGNNVDGRLGVGDTTRRTSPTEVTGAYTFQDISAGYRHTCAITTSGAPYCWGYNDYGQVGSSAGPNTNTLPVEVPLPPGVTLTQISAGYHHTCGLTAAGQAYCWGENSSGELGLGDTTARTEATAIPGLTFASISAGSQYTCAITTSSESYCWGYGVRGNLGGGNTATKTSPTAVQLPAGVTLAQIAAGKDLHTCGLDTTGAAYCWGYNNYGQLGIGGTTSKTTPQLVSGTYSSLSAGDMFTLATTAIALSALTPTFDTPVRTTGGFTVTVTNYDAAYTWTPTVSAGSVSAGTASGSTLPLTVTGLSAGQSATLTITVARTGYSDGSATVTGQAKSTQTVTWSPVTAISTASSTVTPSALASGPVGGGSISYSADSFTTTACSVDSSTAVLTVSGTGDCVVRATAEATADYLEGSAVVTFSLSKAAQPVTWAPSTSLTLPGATVTPTAASVPAGGGAITYSVEDAGSTGCSVNSGTGALTYTGAGECVVRATAEATTAYVQGHTDVTFAISKATPTLTWNPDLVQVLPDTSTTFAATTTSSDGAITYAVTDAGTTSCSVNSGTRLLSFSADGSCEVTATVAGTTDYDEVTSVKTFAIYKSAQTITWLPSTSLDLASLSTDVGGASTSGDGAVSYSVTSAGGTGCAFADSSSPTLTYSAAGTCTVTATAASTVAYAQATESVIIRITKATPTMTWSPTTALVMPAATVSPSSSPSTTSDGTISYAVISDTGTNCTVNSSTGALAYTDTGICQVSASTAGTTRYTAASTTVEFTVSLAPQTITAAASSTSLRPRGTATLTATGSTGSGTVTWTRTSGAGVCTLSGTTVTAISDGTCVLTVSIEPDATYAAASDSITIAVTTPTPPAGGGGSGGSSGGATASSGSGTTTSNGSGAIASAPVDAAQSQDGALVPSTGSTTRGRALPPPPTDVDVKPMRNGTRSTVLIRQPVGVAGSQVLATVVVVRDGSGKVISRLNVALKNGQGEVEVTVPYVADGYTVDVYNVNEVGVSTGALTTSPLVRATTITQGSASGKPTLFGSLLGAPVIFGPSSAKLDAKDKKQLRLIAQRAKVSDERLFVTGFARKGGGSASELASLSTKRAKAAADYLSKQGVRVWIRYWGAGSLNGTGKATDRRVEIRSSANPIPRSLVP